MRDCRTYQMLVDIAYGKHDLTIHLRTSAQRTLAAMDDLNLDDPSDTMLDIIHHLLDGIFKATNKDLEEHLRTPADCEFCDALRMRTLGAAYA